MTSAFLSIVNESVRQILSTELRKDSKTIDYGYDSIAYRKYSTSYIFLIIENSKDNKEYLFGDLHTVFLM